MKDSTIADGGDADRLTARTRRAVAPVALLSAVLGIGALALVVTGGLAAVGSAHPAPWWTAILIAAAYGLAERFAFHIEYRREAISFTLSEVPTALAFLFLSPMTAIAVRIVGSLIAFTAGRRPPAHKLAFNFALFTFETTLGFTIVGAVAGGSGFDPGRFIIGAAIALAVSTLIGSLIVSTAIASVEGDLVRRIRSDVGTILVVSPTSATVAVVSVVPALFGLQYALVSVIPVLVVWLVLLRHGRLGQRHRDLEQLHGFVGVVGRSLDVEEVAADALDEAMRLLRAARGALAVFGADEPVTTCRRGDGLPPMPAVPDDPSWHEVMGSDGPVFCRPGPDGPVVVDGDVKCDEMVVPIRDDRGDLGLLLLGGRTGTSNAFAVADLARLGVLAKQLATSLRKAMLHATVEHAAMHDALTGERNRAAFDVLVTERLAAPNGAGCAAVMMLDLDQFKEVNDTLGHHVGDRVLVEFALRVRSRITDEEVLARFGGDEFALYVHRTDTDAVRDLADRIISDSYTPLQLDGLDVVVPVSIGVAIAGDDDRDAGGVLRRADIAMYAAKRAHLGFEVYRPEIDRRTPERLSLLGDLSEALEHGEMTVHFQPKIDLATSTVIGAEALARWHHARRGWVSPADFVPVAEETGLIRQLTDQVLTASIAAAQRWCAAGYDLHVAVNLSTLDLLDELLPERIAHRLEQHGLAPDRLKLEITESSLMADTPRTMATVDRLHAIGVRLSLDDFGTGYSSLSYLRQLPVSELKIDRGFVANMLLDPQDEVIVRSTIDLGHNLGLTVVAEGIENEAALDRLRTFGCDTGQGFGISRPLDPDLLDRWLSTSDFEVARTGGGPAQRTPASRLSTGAKSSVSTVAPST